MAGLNVPYQSEAIDQMQVRIIMDWAPCLITTDILCVEVKDELMNPRNQRTSLTMGKPMNSARWQL